MDCVAINDKTSLIYFKKCLITSITFFCQSNECALKMNVKFYENAAHEIEKNGV